MINLSEIWVGRKFKYKDKVYTKSNHNRGYSVSEDKERIVINLKKHTKVEEV